MIYSLTLQLADLQLHWAMQVYANSTRATASSSFKQLQAVACWQLEGIDEGIGTNIDISHPKLTSWHSLQVYLSTLKGYVPDLCTTCIPWLLSLGMPWCPQYSLQLCRMLSMIFCMCGVCSSFHLPHQHSLTHFIQIIQAFGAPNKLCSLITKLKHIKAIMKPLIKCYWLTNVWTSSQQHELISKGMVCWTAHACHIHFG